MTSEEFNTMKKEYINKHYGTILDEVMRVKEEKIAEYEKELWKDFDFSRSLLIPVVYTPLAIIFFYGFFYVIFGVKEVFVCAVVVALVVAAVLLATKRAVKRYNHKLANFDLWRAEKRIIISCYIAKSECEMIAEAETTEDEIKIRDFFLISRNNRRDGLTDEIMYKIAMDEHWLFI